MSAGGPPVSTSQVNPYNYTIINGQIFTPGLAIVDAPQPNTPLGGDFLQVALDVSYNGAIGQPPYLKGASSMIYNITIFLASYATGKNFTISNGTASAGNASLEDILATEPGSTVKHVNWTWPDCLIGNGPTSGSRTGNQSARGSYNISMHQAFRLNGSDYYTIFDLPIQVTNEIRDNGSRPSCDLLNNPLLANQQVNATGPRLALPYVVPKFTKGAATILSPSLLMLGCSWFAFGLASLLS
ncbi:hypothetical protein EJ08DRAFT_640987 [Tothia fuscella]|uniref:Uncharacterized protein n=1 Tax=Tothia fuscella TaxID=1048955 RepID=A0A9P4TU93_9PEZI|nr:hypothetical protein EJ08DRAFT_640987 [Tothia fuscella]